MWSDGRAEAETAEIERRIPRELVARTGNRSSVSFTAPKIMWLIARARGLGPDTLGGAAQDALRAGLPARSRATSRCLATLLFDLRARTWAADICKLGIDARRLPRLLESGLGRGAARRRSPDLGLPAGIASRRRRRRSGGAGVGLGRAVDARHRPDLAQDRRPVLALDAPRWIRRAAPRPGHVVPGQWCVMAPSYPRRVLDWIGKTLRPDDANGARELLAWRPRPGRRDGLIFVPYLRGADAALRSGARGAMVGLRIGHGPAELTGRSWRSGHAWPKAWTCYAASASSPPRAWSPAAA
jgi:hypothetical protein